MAVASADQSAFRSGSAATAQKRVLIARRKWGALADGAKKLVAMAGVTLRGEGRLGREAAVAKKKIEDDLKEAERVAEEVLQEGLRIAAEVKRAAEENAVIKKLEEGTKAIAASDLVKKLRETE